MNKINTNTLNQPLISTPMNNINNSTTRDTNRSLRIGESSIAKSEQNIEMNNKDIKQIYATAKLDVVFGLAATGIAAIVGVGALILFSVPIMTVTSVLAAAGLVILATTIALYASYTIFSAIGTGLKTYFNRELQSRYDEVGLMSAPSLDLAKLVQLDQDLANASNKPVIAANFQHLPNISKPPLLSTTRHIPDTTPEAMPVQIKSPMPKPLELYGCAPKRDWLPGMTKPNSAPSTSQILQNNLIEIL